jgi:hypothetical protein
VSGKVLIPGQTEAKELRKESADSGKRYRTHFRPVYMEPFGVTTKRFLPRASTMRSVPIPKPRIYRDIVRRGHKKTYRDAEGNRRYRGGRRIPDGVPARLDPDLPGVRCTGITASGQPCKRWACVGAALCHSHAARRTVKRKPCSAHECPLPYPHRAFSPGCLRDRPGIIMGPSKQSKPATRWNGMPIDPADWPH